MGVEVQEDDEAERRLPGQAQAGDQVHHLCGNLQICQVWVQGAGCLGLPCPTLRLLHVAFRVQGPGSCCHACRNTGQRPRRARSPPASRVVG